MLGPLLHADVPATAADFHCCNVRSPPAGRFRSTHCSCKLTFARIQLRVCGAPT